MGISWREINVLEFAMWVGFFLSMGHPLLGESIGNGSLSKPKFAPSVPQRLRWFPVDDYGICPKLGVFVEKMYNSTVLSKFKKDTTNMRLPKSAVRILELWWLWNQDTPTEHLLVYKPASKLVVKELLPSQLAHIPLVYHQFVIKTATNCW